jgi:exopolysaccharide biosynthesis polyprenyl glycosylphosphotransferase
MKNNYRAKQLILLIGDLICFVFGFYTALILRYLKLDNLSEFKKLIPIFIILFIVWTFINYTNELYKINKLKDKKSNFDLILSAILALLLSIAFFYLLNLSIAPKTILFLTVITSYVLVFFWRLFYKKTLIKTFNQKIIFINENEDSFELRKIIESNPELGFCVYEKKLDSFDNLLDLCKQENIDIIVINDEERKNLEISAELYKLFLNNKKIINLSNFYENITGRMTPNVFSESWFLENLQNINRPFYNRLTRFIDIFFASLLFIIFILFLPFIALIIKLNSNGPIFFTQTRTGLNNKKFKIYKFRTMLALSKDGSAEINGYEFATKTDKRITAIGHFLRKTRIDELPQLINLFKGELTLIGPRPERPEIIENLKEKMPFYELRHVIKPGLTGWAQVNQHYTDTIESSLQKLQYDLYYIKNRSILLDISIIFKTINVVLRGKGQ